MKWLKLSHSQLTNETVSHSLQIRSLCMCVCAVTRPSQYLYLFSVHCTQNTIYTLQKSNANLLFQHFSLVHSFALAYLVGHRNLVGNFVVCKNRNILAQNRSTVCVCVCAVDELCDCGCAQRLYDHYIYILPPTPPHCININTQQKPKNIPAQHIKYNIFIESAEMRGNEEKNNFAQIHRRREKKKYINRVAQSTKYATEKARDRNSS